LKRFTKQQSGEISTGRHFQIGNGQKLVPGRFPKSGMERKLVTGRFPEREWAKISTGTFLPKPGMDEN